MTIVDATSHRSDISDGAMTASSQKANTAIVHTRHAFVEVCVAQTPTRAIRSLTQSQTRAERGSRAGAGHSAQVGDSDLN